jgi:thiamine kinase-like enzyme
LAANVQDLVARLEPELGAIEGEPRALDGGITNRNFRLRLGGADYVVRCPSKNTAALGIDRAAERAATEAAARSGTAPGVAAFLADEGCLVTEFIAGKELTAADVRQPETLSAIAGLLRGFHDGPALTATFDPLAIAADYRATIVARGGEPPDGYDTARATMEQIAGALAADPEHAPVPCHNDLLPANFLRDGERVRIIDWEYAGMADRFFDLANLSVNCELADPDEARLLEAYFGEPATPRRLAGLRLMKLVSDFREAMWGAIQAALADDDADFDYAAYAVEHMQRLTANAADPRFDAWMEVARGD